MAKVASIPSGRRNAPSNSYNKYRDRVHFVVVDLDLRRSPAQQELVKRYHNGYIPHVAVLDAGGKALYDADGEVASRMIEDILEQSWQTGRVKSSKSSSQP